MEVESERFGAKWTIESSTFISALTVLQLCLDLFQFCPYFVAILIQFWINFDSILPPLSFAEATKCTPVNLYSCDSHDDVRQRQRGLNYLRLLLLLILPFLLLTKIDKKWKFGLRLVCWGKIPRHIIISDAVCRYSRHLWAARWPLKLITERLNFWRLNHH